MGPLLSLTRWLLCCVSLHHRTQPLGSGQGYLWITEKVKDKPVLTRLRTCDDDVSMAVGSLEVTPVTNVHTGVLESRRLEVRLLAEEHSAAESCGVPVEGDDASGGGGESCGTSSADGP